MRTARRVLSLTLAFHALPAAAYTEAEKAAYLAARGANGMYGANERNYFTNPQTLNPVVALPGSLQAIEVPGNPNDCVDVLDYFLPTAIAPLPAGQASQSKALEATAPDFTDGTWFLGHTWGTHNPRGYRYSGYLYKTKWQLADRFEYYTWDQRWVYLHQDNTSTEEGNNIQYTGFLRSAEVWHQGATVYPRSMCLGMVANTPRVVHKNVSGAAITLNAATVMLNRFTRVWGDGVNGGKPTETIRIAVLQNPDMRADAVKFNDHLTYAYADVAYYAKGYGFVAFEDSEPSHPVVSWTWPAATKTVPKHHLNRNPFLWDSYWGYFRP